MQPPYTNEALSPTISAILLKFHRSTSPKKGFKLYRRIFLSLAENKAFLRSFLLIYYIGIVLRSIYYKEEDGYSRVKG